MSDVKKKVNDLIRIHETRDPFRIAKYEGFIIRYYDFDKIKGYYCKVLKKKFIIINQNLDELSKRIVCAHELGHGILHNPSETYFMKEYTLFPTHSKTEREANKFAAELIISDLYEYDNYYKDDIGLSDNVFSELLTLKFEHVN